MLHRDGVLCVLSSASSCVLLHCFVVGCLRRSTRKVSGLPTLVGGTSAVASPATWTDLLGSVVRIKLEWKLAIESNTLAEEETRQHCEEEVDR